MEERLPYHAARRVCDQSVRLFTGNTSIHQTGILSTVNSAADLMQDITIEWPDTFDNVTMVNKTKQHIMHKHVGPLINQNISWKPGTRSGS